VNLYELINMSDGITFYAPDDTTACAVALITGGGHYAAHTADDEERDAGGMLLFASEERIKTFMAEKFGPEEFEPWYQLHESEVADALDSLAVVGADVRPTYDLAIQAYPGHRAIHHDRCRSSMNDICGRAWKRAASMRAKPEAETETRNEVAR
jgi:hypothetical protein